MFDGVDMYIFGSQFVIVSKNVERPFLAVVGVTVLLLLLLRNKELTAKTLKILFNHKPLLVVRRSRGYGEDAEPWERTWFKNLQSKLRFQYSSTET